MEFERLSLLSTVGQGLILLVAVLVYMLEQYMVEQGKELTIPNTAHSIFGGVTGTLVAFRNSTCSVHPRPAKHAQQPHVSVLSCVTLACCCRLQPPALHGGTLVAVSVEERDL